MLIQSTYGITLSSETFTIIVLAIGIGIIVMWVKAFVAKPETLSADFKSIENRLNKEIADLKLEIKDLKHAILDNTKDDRKEREDVKGDIKEMQERMWNIIRDALKK